MHRFRRILSQKKVSISENLVSDFFLIFLVSVSKNLASEKSLGFDLVVHCQGEDSFANFFLFCKIKSILRLESRCR